MNTLTAPSELTNDHKRRCAFVAPYWQINANALVTTWRDEPHISVSDMNWPEEYRTPQIKETSQGTRQVIEVLVLDESAVDLQQQDLLGDCLRALNKCEDALKARGYYIIRRDW